MIEQLSAQGEVCMPDHPVILEEDTGLPGWAKSAFPKGLTDTQRERIQGAMGMLMNFESLGMNCRLGFVQRAYKCEPLGLMRWGGVSLHSLFKTIENEWAGVDDPANMDVHFRDDLGHFMVVENLYPIVFHTAETDRNTPIDAIKSRMAISLKFLRRKLLEDLRGGSKYFVVFMQDPDPAEDVASGVYDKLLAFNPKNRLMFVCHNDDPAAYGRVTRQSENLIKGHVRSKNDVFEDGLFYPDWIALCEQAEKAWS